jgi:hypothetical protein
MPNFLLPSFASALSSNTQALRFDKAASVEAQPIERAIAALTEAVLAFCDLSHELLHGATAHERRAEAQAQLKAEGDRAVAAMQELRLQKFAMSGAATQLSQALTVLVLVASLIQNQPEQPLDPELRALLAHNTQRARHSLNRLHGCAQRRRESLESAHRRGPALAQEILLLR